MTLKSNYNICRIKGKLTSYFCEVPNIENTVLTISILSIVTIHNMVSGTVTSLYVKKFSRARISRS